MDAVYSSDSTHRSPLAFGNSHSDGAPLAFENSHSDGTPLAFGNSHSDGTQLTPVSLAVWGATDKGREREGNEDAIFPHSGVDSSIFEPGPRHLAQKGQLLIVADGVGGAKGGREASHWAIRVAVERYYDTSGPDLGTDLKSAVEIANNSLYQYNQSTGTGEAGCTMAAAVIYGNTLHVANVGDSRVYLLRNGQIVQLTRDHTLTQQKIDQGIIRPEQAETDSGRHVLTRSMGAAQTVQVDLFPPLQLASGDVVLVCSDGLTDMLTDAEIIRSIGNNSPKQAVRRLIAAANRSGGVDNISVIIAQVGARPSPVGGGVFDAIRQMPRRRKMIWSGGAVLTIAVVCIAASLGWWMYGRQQVTPTPSPTTTMTSTSTMTPTMQATVTEQPAETTPSDRVTSTPAPTFTPTNTPLPTPTDTPTPMPTFTSEPTSTAQLPQSTRRPQSTQPPPPSPEPLPTQKPTAPPPPSP